MKKPFKEIISPIIKKEIKMNEYDNLIDIINCARLSGLIPIDVSISQDLEMRNYEFDSELGVHIFRPIQGYVIKIRLSEQ